jgi:hypothetical protein
VEKSGIEEGESKMGGEGREMVNQVQASEVRLLTGVTGRGVECSSVVLRHCDSCLYVGYENANAADRVSFTREDERPEGSGRPYGCVTLP